MGRKRKKSAKNMPEVTSMEEFGPVAVDYFTQHRVTEVEIPDKTEDGPTWIVHFEGGGQIWNFEPEVPTPTAIVGQELTRTIFDSTRRVTRLQFGLEQITLNPLKYAILDPNYTKGKLVFAQTSHVNQLPAEPEGRTAEGPDQEWLDAQEEA